MRYKYSAVVVLYQPEKNIISNIMTYAGSVEKIYAVDNSNVYDNSLISQIAIMENVKYISLHGNKGLAAALNYGCRLAREEGFDYILTMDQDSYFEEGAVQAMIDYVEKAKDSNLGIVAPCVNAIFDNMDSRLSRNAIDLLQNEVKEENWVMTSGSLMDLRFFYKVGKFDEKLFIEHIDIDIGIKMYLNNLRILKIKAARINQRFGNSEPRNFLGRTIHPMFSSPVRTYYLVRNQIYIIKKYGMKFLRFTNVSLFKTLIKLLFFEPGKFIRIQMFLRGMKDGFSNHMGEYI